MIIKASVLLRYLIPFYDPDIKNWSGEARLMRWLTFAWLIIGLIVEPEKYVADFAKAGADIISVHAEHNASPHLHRTLGQIRELGKQAGVVLNPSTPLDLIEHVLELCDLVLIMSVNPGFGGQSFIPGVIPKIQKLRRMCDERGLDPWIEVDGGLKPNNTWQVLEAGANAIVAGSAVFNAPDYAIAVEGVRNSKRPEPQLAAV